MLGPALPLSRRSDDEERGRGVRTPSQVFEPGKPLLVCGNTASMIQETRFARHFTVQGDRSTHYGLFPCGPAVTTTGTGSATGGACC